MRRTNIERFKSLNDEELEFLTQFRLLDIRAARQERARENIRGRTITDGRARGTRVEHEETDSSTSSKPEVTNDLEELELDTDGAPIYRGATLRVLTKTRSRSAPFFGITAARATGVDHRGWILLEATKVLRNGSSRTVNTTRKGNNLQIVH